MSKKHSKIWNEINWIYSKTFYYCVTWAHISKQICFFQLISFIFPPEIFIPPPFFMSLACIWGKGIFRLGMLSSLNANMFVLTTMQLTQFKFLWDAIIGYPQMTCWLQLSGLFILIHSWFSCRKSLCIYRELAYMLTKGGH